MKLLTLITLCATLCGALHAGYTASTITLNYNGLDLSSSGTAIDRTGQFVPFAANSGYAVLDEGKLDNVAIGFSFDFYGVAYTTVDVSANCFLCFDDIDFASFGVLPNLPALPQKPNNFIMCAAGDYGFLGAVPGNVRVLTEVIGSAPNREFRVQWKGFVAVIGADPVNVICRLMEGTNVIEVHADVGSGGTLSHGRVIAGVEDASGTRAIPSLDGWTMGQKPGNAWRWTPKTGPEIELYRADGTNQPNNFQHDMEDRTQGISFNNTYTIRNAGTTDLILSSGVTLQSGATNCTGQVLQQPATSTLTPGASASFIVQVTPTSASAGTGDFLANFRVVSNDTSEANFNIFVVGKAVTASVPDLFIGPAPGMVLTYDALAGGRLFHEVGRVTKSQVYTYTYTIQNTAAGTLNLTGSPRVTFSGSGAIFAVTQQPPASIAGFGSATFTVTLQPTGGDIFAGISVPNNDPWSIEANWGNIVVGYGVDPVACNIDLQRPAGTSRANNSTDGFGSVASGVAQNRTYTIANTGTTGLNLTGTPLVEFSQVSNCACTLVSAPANFVAAGGATTFDISILPGAGAFSCKLVVRSDDTNDNPYTLTLTGNGITPGDIDIQRPAGTSIVDGGTDTASGAQTGVTSQHVYTIENKGTGTLTLTSAAPVSSANPVNLSGAITLGQPATLTLAPGATTTFTVDFTPAGAGAFSFDLDVLSDDPDEGNYDIHVAGTASEADIDVRNPASTSLVNAGSDTLNSAIATVAVARTYSIFSAGGNNLVLNASPVSIAGASNIAGSVVVTQPATLTLAPGTSTTFQLDFTVAAPGAFSFVVSIASNDPDESPFSFTLGGNAGATAPEIEVRRLGATVSSTSVDFVGSNFTGGAAAPLTYTIHNLGTAALVLSGAPAVVVSNNSGCIVSVTTQPAAGIAAGAQETAIITVTPSSQGGGFSFDVSIASDDSDENPYTFSVSGSASSLIGGGGGSGGGGGGCASSPVPAGTAPLALLLPAALALLHLRRRKLA